MYIDIQKKKIISMPVIEHLVVVTLTYTHAHAHVSEINRHH